MLSLLGLAGSSAATVAGWLSPVLLIVSVGLLGRAHYVLYILRRGTLTTTVITWLATTLVTGFWGWKIVDLAGKFFE